jgi:hypothetical protein
LPVSLIGNEVESVPCFELSVVCKSTPARETVPKKALVADAYVNDPRVVDEFVNDCSAVHELAFAMFSDRVVFDPPICEPSVPDDVIEPPTASDDVAAVETLPFEPTNATPCVCVGRKNEELIVVDELEKRPLMNPITVEVELYVGVAVYGKAYVLNPASLLNHESLTDDEAIVETSPFEPVKAKP